MRGGGRGAAPSPACAQLRSVGLEERRGDGRRRLLVDRDRLVERLDRVEGQQRVDLVERRGERRTLLREQLAAHDRRDVLVAEDVLWIGQDHVLAGRRQLTVGGEDVLHVDLAGVKRRVAQADRDRLEGRVDAVLLLEPQQPLEARRELRRRAQDHLRAELLEVGDRRQVVGLGVGGQHRQRVGVIERRRVQQREPVRGGVGGCLLVGGRGAGRVLGDPGDRRQQRARVLGVEVDLAGDERLPGDLGGADVVLQRDLVALRRERLRVKRAEDVLLGKVLVPDHDRGLAAAGQAGGARLDPDGRQRARPPGRPAKAVRIKPFRIFPPLSIDLYYFFMIGDWKRAVRADPAGSAGAARPPGPPPPPARARRRRSLRRARRRFGSSSRC